MSTLKTSDLDCKYDGTVLQGYIAYDSASPDKRPGVLVAHDWMGVGPFVRQRVEQLAQLGYVALALDLYGRVPKDLNEAGELSDIYLNDRTKMRAHAGAALNALRTQSEVDGSQMAAIGYCLGGTIVLELARAGADLKGVVSFHGGLDTPTPNDARNIRGRVLILHGADDPHVRCDEVAAFEYEMRKAGVGYKLVKYGGAVHGFTNPEADGKKLEGVAYNEEAARDSWEEMVRLFAEIFR